LDNVKEGDLGGNGVAKVAHRWYGSDDSEREEYDTQ
jgi:hypothetical protein